MATAAEREKAAVDKVESRERAAVVFATSMIMRRLSIPALRWRRGGGAPAPAAVAAFAPAVPAAAAAAVAAAAARKRRTLGTLQLPWFTALDAFSNVVLPPPNVLPISAPEAPAAAAASQRSASPYSGVMSAVLLSCT